MKKIIFGIYAAFLVLMGVTFYVAQRADDVVVPHYYEKASHFFSDKDMPGCEIDKGTCSAKAGNAEVILEVTPRPVRAMKELSFTIVVRRSRAALPGVLTLDLAMPGMYMGNNRVLLRRTAEGTYEGKGVIPRCPSGGRLWKAAVDIPKEGGAAFTFNVSY